MASSPSTPEPPVPTVEILEGGREQARARHPGAAWVSRSYSPPYAVVAVHHAAVGVDIEAVGVLEDAFSAAICTPTERERLRGASAAELTSVWSSKEALSKALGDALDYDPRRLEAPVFWPDGRAGRWRARPLEVPPGYVGWLCWTD